MSLSSKKVLIVGASGGIGSSLVKRFKDSELILIDRNEDKISKMCEDLGIANYQKYVLDISKTDNIKEVGELISEKNETIDILINATGIGLYKPIEDVEVSEWHTSLDVNVTGAYFLIKYLLDPLKKSEKSYVVSLGSGMGKIPTPGRSVYCITKFALRGMSLSLSEEFKGTNVHFLHMVLGSVLTGFAMDLEKKKEKSLSGKSYLSPDSVAEKIYTLVSEDTEEVEVEFMPSGYTDPLNR